MPTTNSIYILYIPVICNSFAEGSMCLSS